MIIHGDSIDELKKLEPNSVDAIVTDPPYGLGNTSPKHVAECLRAWSAGETWQPTGRGFMGRSWDAWVPPPELWREVLRVLKPGGHAIVFAGSRTQDLMSVSLRLAGFEVRDVLMWLYSNGFPKSHNVEKSTGDAQWAGWGTALKPAYEPALLVRKPLGGTVARCVLEHGTGALNIDASRVGERFPANVMIDEHVAGQLDAQSGERRSGARKIPLYAQRDAITYGQYNGAERGEFKASRGGASRFFYSPKASKAEREAGLASLPLRKAGAMVGAETRPDRPTNHPMRANTHPTVKPIELMRYLVRMITPPRGVVLDPFAGSGSTLCAAALEGFAYIGIEREVEYVEIARARVAHHTPDEDTDERQLSLFPHS